jgi:hypothetical protein
MAVKITFRFQSHTFFFYVQSLVDVKGKTAKAHDCMHAIFFDEPRRHNMHPSGPVGMHERPSLSSSSTPLRDSDKRALAMIEFGGARLLLSPCMVSGKPTLACGSRSGVRRVYVGERRKDARPDDQ